MTRRNSVVRCGAGRKFARGARDVGPVAGGVSAAADYAAHAAASVPTWRTARSELAAWRLHNTVSTVSCAAQLTLRTARRIHDVELYTWEM